MDENKRAKKESPELLKERINRLKLGTIPKHIALVMDGNRRWAQSQGLNRLAGHREGAKRLPELFPFLIDLGVQTVTTYAFSTENWKRSNEEVSLLFRLFKQQLQQKKSDLIRLGIHLKVIGDREALDQSVLQEIEEIEAATKNETNLNLLFAWNYGGRSEILRAMNKWLKAQGSKSFNDLNSSLSEEEFEKYLDTAHYSDPDLIIRTSGEHRLSNFLLWQSAYSEMLFIKECWPEFKVSNLLDSIEVYQARERRYGGI